jgi:hypothetical protein
METINPVSQEKQSPHQFPPLESVTRPTVETAAAAYYLNRQPQTLRCWAVYQNGAVNPIRVCGRLAWKVSDLRKVLGVSS